MIGEAKLGTITLCQTCHHAIQLRRCRVRGSYSRGRPWVDLDMWEHMGPPSVTGPWHEVQPMREVGA